MKEMKVYFADGTTAIFHEDQSFQRIVYCEENQPLGKGASMSSIVTLWNHTHDGLFPSFFDVIANSEFFFDIEKPETYYNSKAIVKIEQI